MTVFLSCNMIYFYGNSVKFLILYIIYFFYIQKMSKKSSLAFQKCPTFCRLRQIIVNFCTLFKISLQNKCNLQKFCVCGEKKLSNDIFFSTLRVELLYDSFLMFFFLKKNLRLFSKNLHKFLMNLFYVYRLCGACYDIMNFVPMDIVVLVQRYIE